jgi:hypothetical protein
MPFRDDPIAWLRAKGAQGDVIDGVGAILARAAPADAWPHLWATCPRGDWLLGIATRLDAPAPALVQAAIGCARIAITEDEAHADPLLRSGLDLLSLAERWAGGNATDDELRAATRALDEASVGATSPATDAALRAVLAVGMGLDDREVLAGAAAFAAESMMMATLDCGMPLVMSYAHGKCADAVRAAVPWAVAEALLERVDTARA